MWTPTTRAQHSRSGLRYGSDLTDAEWAILCPFLRAEAKCGRKRAYPMREIVNAICYVLHGGIAWRLMPDSFPPWRTVYRWFAELRDDGMWETINHHLVMRDLAASRLAVAGLTALREQIAAGGGNLRFVAPVGISAEQSMQAYGSVQARADEQVSKLAALDQQMAEKRVEAVEDAGTIDKLKIELPMLAGIGDMYSQLNARRLATTVDLLSSLQRYSDAAHDLAIQIAHRGEAVTELAALQRQYQAQQANYAHRVLQDLSDAQRKLSDDDAGDRAAAHAAGKTVLRSPSTGTVQQLALHSLNGVVTPGERLMVIVPDHDKLVVEAMVNNRDIGFVHAGQAVNVKVGAFSFTRYGMIRGRVLSLSRDSVDDSPRDSTTQNIGGAGATAHLAGDEFDLDGGVGGDYTALVKLDYDALDGDGRSAALEPGMSVTAEILTGRRRIISYLLSPIMRSAQDAGRER